MTEAGKRLLAAANEALAFAKGEAEPGSYVIHALPPAVDVKAIRKSMNMTQVAFGERFGFGTARVRDWEQKRTHPTASDRVLLTTIKFAPDVVLEALAGAQTRGFVSSSNETYAQFKKSRLAKTPTGARRLKAATV